MSLAHKRLTFGSMYKYFLYPNNWSVFIIILWFSFSVKFRGQNTVQWMQNMSKATFSWKLSHSDNPGTPNTLEDTNWTLNRSSASMEFWTKILFTVIRFNTNMRSNLLMLINKFQKLSRAEQWPMQCYSRNIAIVLARISFFCTMTNEV